MVTHQLQVKRRTGKVRRPETDVLPGCTLFNSECTISAKNTLRIGPAVSLPLACYTGGGSAIASHTARPDSIKLLCRIHGRNHWVSGALDPPTLQKTLDPNLHVAFWWVKLFVAPNLVYLSKFVFLEKGSDTPDQEIGPPPTLQKWLRPWSHRVGGVDWTLTLNAFILLPTQFKPHNATRRDETVLSRRA